MDDFYSEMKEILDESKPIQESTTIEMSSFDYSSGSSSYAHALVPVNPTK